MSSKLHRDLIQSFQEILSFIRRVKTDLNTATTAEQLNTILDETTYTIDRLCVLIQCAYTARALDKKCGKRVKYIDIKTMCETAANLMAARLHIESASSYEHGKKLK